MLLEGKKAVVTGGTRGIGFAVVETFLKNGASVALFGSRQETVDKALAKLKAENPDWDVMGLAPDLTDYAAVEAAMAKVTEAFGRIDILVNMVKTAISRLSISRKHFFLLYSKKFRGSSQKIQSNTEYTDLLYNY